MKRKTLILLSTIFFIIILSLQVQAGVYYQNEYDPLASRIGNVYVLGNETVTVQSDQGYVYLNDYWYSYESGKYESYEYNYVLNRKPEYDENTNYYYSIIAYDRMGVHYCEADDTLIIYSGKFGEVYTRSK